MKVGQLRRQMLMLKFFVMILFFRKLIILETTPKTKNSRVSILGHVTSRVNHSLKLLLDTDSGDRSEAVCSFVSKASGIGIPGRVLSGEGMPGRFN